MIYYTITDTTEKKDTEAVSLMKSFNDIDNQELGEDNSALVHDDEDWHQETAHASNSIHGQPSENLGTGIWDKVFKNGSSKICGRQPLKKFEVISFLIF